MGGSPSTLDRLGHLLLAMSLCTATFMSSAVGAGLVVHQHGFRGAHLHLLGQADSPVSAAWSSQFGHAAATTTSFVSASEPVKVVAIILTASKLGWAPGGMDDGEVHSVSTTKSLSEDQTSSKDQHAAAWPANLQAAWTGHSAPISIVLRSHTLLI